MQIINRAKIGKTMLQDVKNTVGSIYRMNAPRSIGYGFDPHRLGKKIARGMFIDRLSEIPEWTYYLDFKTGVLRRTEPVTRKKRR
jgi:hypothetical protein